MPRFSSPASRVPLSLALLLASLLFAAGAAHATKAQAAGDVVSAGSGSCRERFPGDPCGTTLYYGAAVEGGDPRPLETQVRHGLGLFRSYFRADSTPAAMVQRAEADTAAGRLPLMSTKLPGSWQAVADGQYDDWLVDRIEGLAKVAGPVWLALHHEPSGDGDPADWVAMQQHARTLIDEHADNIALVGILNGWDFIKQGGDPEAFNHPLGSGVDVMGFDSYNGWSPSNDKEWKTVDEAMSPGLAIESWGYPTLIAETGVRTDADHPGRAADWLQEQLDFAVENDFLAVSYFDSGANSPDGTWDLTGERLRQFAENLGAAETLDPCLAGCATGSLALDVSPSTPTLAGEPVTLSATIVPSDAAGSVVFEADGEPLGPGVLIESGTASMTTSDLGPGVHQLVARYLASPDWATLEVSASNTVTHRVEDPVAEPTATTMSAYAVTDAGTPSIRMAATVTSEVDGTPVPAGAGTVRFFDGTQALGEVAIGTDPVELVAPDVEAGVHSLKARFVPVDVVAYQRSASAPVAITVDVASGCQDCADPQDVVVNVPSGGLSITTPYTPDNPFDLGSMGLDDQGIAFSVSAPFPRPGDELTVTDTRAGSLPWNASMTSTDFVGTAGTINAQNASFTGVTVLYIPANALNPSTNPVLAFDADSLARDGLPYQSGDPGSDGLAGEAHTFASAVHGTGSVRVRGTLALAAPTSTAPGTFVATLTFTVT